MAANLPFEIRVKDIANAVLALLLLALWVLYIWKTSYGYTGAYIAWSVLGWLSFTACNLAYENWRHNRQLAAAPTEDIREYLEDHPDWRFRLPLTVVIAIASGLLGNFAVMVYGAETATGWTVVPLSVVVFGGVVISHEKVKDDIAEARHNLRKEVRRSRKGGHVLINPPHMDGNTNRQGGLE